jgi:hypothetical protein
MTPRPPSRTPGQHARSLVLHAAGGALAGAVLTVVLLLAIEITNAGAARQGAPPPELLAAAAARLDLGVLPLMAAFGGAAGLASWTVAILRPPR